MGELVELVAELLVLVEKLIEGLVERRAADHLLRIVDGDGNLPLLQHDGQDALRIHIEIDHANGVQLTMEGELSVYDITGVDVCHLAILDSPQIEFAAIKRGDRRGSLHMVGVHTRRKDG